ncbi:hypothetical protein CASFOL_016978 [Castilleja foliolosa]|uniref:RPN1 N-terminal domain-containing protein n=1 Tax=Castilleja foliolosa TaxID=1961234 RepID=A0ABD3DDQ2_9LAMI
MWLPAAGDCKGKEVTSRASQQRMNGGRHRRTWARFRGNNRSDIQWKIEMKDSSVDRGKEILLIPEHTQVLDSSLVSRCPHRSEIQSIVLAESESSQLSIWDLRVKENGGCVHKITGSVGDILYAVSMSSTGNVGAGGAEHTVTIYDQRRWCAVSRWLNCSKYEITGLTFSSVGPNYICVQGVDYEFLKGSIILYNAEPEAVDILMKDEDIDLLLKYVDQANYERTCIILRIQESK